MRLRVAQRSSPDAYNGLVVGVEATTRFFRDLVYQGGGEDGRYL